MNELEHKEDFQMTEDEIELRVRVQKELVKNALKEALKEWLNEKFMAFGKWTFFAFAAAAFGGLVYFILALSGWKGPGK